MKQFTEDELRKLLEKAYDEGIVTGEQMEGLNIAESDYEGFKNKWRKIDIDTIMKEF